MKHRTHKLAAKAVAAILCAALMLTACGSKETTSNETASTETTSATATEATSVESTEMTTTEAAVEPTEAPTETPAESPAPAVESTAAPVESTAVSTGYTYSELSQTMYAKSAVNIRDLPSTDGKKIGSLKASQEITVTGKCDQTGWYRFDGKSLLVITQLPRSRIPQHLRLRRQPQQGVQNLTSTVLWQNRYLHWSITTV